MAEKRVVVEKREVGDGKGRAQEVEDETADERTAIRRVQHAQGTAACERVGRESR